MGKERKLRKINNHSWLGGVCAGAAYFFGVPVWLVRLVWLCSILGYGIGAGIYLILWIVLPRWEWDPDDFKKVTGD